MKENCKKCTSLEEIEIPNINKQYFDSPQYLGVKSYYCRDCGLIFHKVELVMGKEI